MLKKIKDWWHDEYVPYENDPNSFVVFIGGEQKRHWTSTAAHNIWAFLGREWKWVIGVVIAITAILVRLI